MGENKSRDRYIAGGIKWRLGDLHIIRRLREVADSREENIRDSKVVLLRGDSSSGEWSLPFPMSAGRAIKAAEVERPTDRPTDQLINQPTNQPTRWITAIRIYAACTVPEVVAPFGETAREVVLSSGSLRLLSPRCFYFTRGDIFAIHFRVGANRPNASPGTTFYFETPNECCLRGQRGIVL